MDLTNKNSDNWTFSFCYRISNRLVIIQTQFRFESVLSLYRVCIQSVQIVQTKYRPKSELSLYKKSTEKTQIHICTAKVQISVQSLY